MSMNAQIARVLMIVMAAAGVSNSAAEVRSSPRKASKAHGQTAPSPADGSPEAPQPDAAPTGTADEEKLPPPFNLPTASRARMRACGERWQSMKMAGETGDQIWREFATRCLTEKETGGPNRAPSKGSEADGR